MVVAGAASAPVTESEGCDSETDYEHVIVAIECAESAADPLRTDNVGCSSYQYGRPVDSDCGGPTGANEMIHRYSDEALQVREFLGISGVEPQHAGYRKVQTPKSFAFGKSLRSLRVDSLKVFAK